MLLHAIIGVGRTSPSPPHNRANFNGRDLPPTARSGPRIVGAAIGLRLRCRAAPVPMAFSRRSALSGLAGPLVPRQPGRPRVLAARFRRVAAATERRLLRAIRTHGPDGRRARNSATARFLRPVRRHGPIVSPEGSWAAEPPVDRFPVRVPHPLRRLPPWVRERQSALARRERPAGAPERSRVQSSPAATAPTAARDTPLRTPQRSCRAPATPIPAASPDRESASGSGRTRIFAKAPPLAGPLPVPGLLQGRRRGRHRRMRRARPS